MNTSKKNFNFLKYLSLVLIFTTSFSCPAFAKDTNIKTIIPNPPEINAQAYILIDYNSNKVLLEKNADMRLSPASLTKIMTSYVIGNAIKEGKINQDDIVTVSKNAWATRNPIFKGSSLMFLKPGDHVLMSQLRRGIILQSGNDACVAAAEYLTGSQDSFIDLMNRYGELLNLKNTHFLTVHGLDVKGQYSSARDMALLSRALIHDVPDEYLIYHEKEFTFNNIRQMNRNGLLWDTTLNVDGVKTGHTKKAGYNIVTSSLNNKKMRLISVVLGSHSYKERENESKKLLTWGFHFFDTVLAVKADKELTSTRIWFGKKNQVKLGVKEDVYVTIPRNKVKDIQTKYKIKNIELLAPVKKNQVVGIVYIQLNGEENIKEIPLVVLEDIKECGFFQRLIDYIKRFFYKLQN